jgi:hypothetical protein
LEHAIQFFLNLEFRKQTKTIALADELLITVKTEIIRGASYISDIEINKISIWAKSNKIKCNQQTSKVTETARRKRKEKKEITV